MDWKQQFEIIKQKSEALLTAQGRKFSLSSMENLLGVTRGKATHWTKGQIPSASDLRAISKYLGLSAEWLLFGEGEPEESPTRTIPMPPNDWGGRPCVVRDNRGTERVTGNIVTVSAYCVDLAEEDVPEVKTCIPSELFLPQLKVYRAEDDVMEPIIREGAWVGVDTGSTRLLSGQIYALKGPDNEVAFREIHMDIAKAIVVMQATDVRHPEVTISLDEYKQRVIGKVCWVIQRI